jgi:hypothetical protein
MIDDRLFQSTINNQQSTIQKLAGLPGEGSPAFFMAAMLKNCRAVENRNGLVTAMMRS